MKTRFWLKTHKANKAGKAPISLRLTLNGTAEVSTHIRVLPSEWGGHDAKIITSTAAAVTYNKSLDILAAKATLTAAQLEMLPDRTGPVTAAEIARAMRPKKIVLPTPSTPEPTLTDLLTTALHTAYGAGNEGTLTSYGASLKVWTKWPASQGLLLTGLTASVTAAFAGWLKQHYAPTSRATMLAGLNALLKHAAPAHPATFAGLAKGCKTQRKQRKSVKRDTIDELFSCENLTPAQTLARDVFMTQYYLHGSRVGAILELRKEQIDLTAGRVRFTTHKSTRYKDVAIPSRLRPVLEKYMDSAGPLLFPYLPADYFKLDKSTKFKEKDNARATLGNALYRLSERVGLPVRLHSHIARHTAALRAYEKTKDLRVPQQMLGHASIAETAGYIASLSTDELDSAVASVYED
ncbi:tyrosine-type recombinase/integrase [Hymenobacter sediminis]|uniref:tyrosine-type recombinase/integrase n=1 Tax=Hymenobacter sediminis TaxID=2218621 RepID=UPI00138FBB20|nr:site-specific integrase [Hymenobacter sediminis]